MPKILEVLRLHAEANLSDRAIARSLTMSHVSVGNILSRAEAAGISWPLPEDCDEAQLENLLFAQLKAGTPYCTGIRLFYVKKWLSVRNPHFAGGTPLCTGKFYGSKFRSSAKGVRSVWLRKNLFGKTIR